MGPASQSMGRGASGRCGARVSLWMSSMGPAARSRGEEGAGLGSALSMHSVAGRSPLMPCAYTGCLRSCSKLLYVCRTRSPGTRQQSRIVPSYRVGERDHCLAAIRSSSWANSSCRANPFSPKPTSRLFTLGGGKRNFECYALRYRFGCRDRDASTTVVIATLDRIRDAAAVTIVQMSDGICGVRYEIDFNIK